ncbi:hypothetical protein TURU_123683 [Turdus rufiventris]|nr:hypothetical protein TURU_123683 [Turdus rufiventris]
MLKRQNPSAPERSRDLAADGGALSMSHNDSRSFFNLSQLVLSAGQIKPSPALKHSKITYFEVEIVDVQSKKQICIVDKVPPASTILDVKHKFHKACKYYGYQAGDMVRSLSLREIVKFIFHESHTKAETGLTAPALNKNSV